MKKILCALVMSGLMLSFINANECEQQDSAGFYVGGLGGFNFNDNDTVFSHKKYSKSYVAGVFSGYKFSNHLRLEGEVTLAENTSEETIREHFRFLRRTYKIRSYSKRYSLMANLLYEGAICCNWHPYFGIGAGYARIENKKLNRFIAQGIAGIAYQAGIYKIGLDYRRVDIYKFRSENVLALSLARYF